MVRCVNMWFAEYQLKKLKVMVMDTMTWQSFTIITDTPKGTYRNGNLNEDFAWDLSKQIVRRAEKEMPTALIDMEVILGSLLKLFK